MEAEPNNSAAAASPEAPTPTVAATPAEIDAAWMSAVLRQAGVLKDNRVERLTYTKIGHGMLSDCFRFSLDYLRADPALPRTLVGKFAAANPTSKATAFETNRRATMNSRNPIVPSMAKFNKRAAYSPPSI